MAHITKYKVDGYECYRLTDVYAGKRFQYAIKLSSFTKTQWLKAHNAVLQAVEKSQGITSKQLKMLVQKYLEAPKDTQVKARLSGIGGQSVSALAEVPMQSVFAAYLMEYTQAGINTDTMQINANRQCARLQEFLKEKGVYNYSDLKRNIVAQYPAWRNAHRYDNRSSAEAGADTVNKELNRLAAVIRHGIKYHGWQERYLLDGIKVKATTTNTKAVRPFELDQVKAIFKWLRERGNWYLHDTVLLALCTGMEAKALDKMRRDWFKPDIGILRVFDKLVSGVIDAKNQNRARDIPITATMRQIYERGYIFSRPESRWGDTGTEFRRWGERALRACEKETGIAEINLHRFRHTCATARLSAGWQLVRVSRMLGHSNINTTAKHYAEYDLSASPEGFEGMIAVYKDFCEWLDKGYFSIL